MKINVLSSEIYNKISAGEVVERPASVVKELVENSIDSGATKISIEICGGGIQKIIVLDNGCGIEPDDMEKAIMPHATSKISASSDLENIVSLGFRGEALASISAVSKVELVSRNENYDNGTILEVEGGKIISKREVGADIGTKIVIRDLFFNTPARLKFLKKSKSEEGEVTNMVAKLILANPELSIRYLVDDKIIYNTFGNGLAEALYIIYGKETYDNLLEIDYVSGDISVKGFIARPTFCKANRTYQTIFINGRVVSNYMISSAVQDALEGFIMKGKFPLFAINISMPYSMVDVNVHPSKNEVKFENSSRIYGIVNTAIYKAVSNTNYVQAKIDEPAQIEVDKTTLPNISKKEGFSFGDFLKKTDSDNLVFKSSENSTLAKIIHDKETSLQEVEIESVKTKPQEKFLDLKTAMSQKQDRIDEIFEKFTIIGTVFETYILIEKDDKLLVIDQHAGHERQLYDKIMKEIEKNEVSTQELLVPYVFEVNNKEKEFLEENIQTLKNFGIEMSEFGDKTFKVSTIPYVLSNMNLKEFFELILSDINSLLKKPISFINDKFTKMACRSAVKAGDKLSQNEIEILIKNFVANKNVLLCPHGRPVVVEIKKTEIEKWFKRIV